MLFACTHEVAVGIDIEFARVAATPIGPGLAARDGGLTLTTLGQVNTQRMARSDIANLSGTCGVEFVAWGEDAQSAIIGICTPAAALSARLGSSNYGIAWDLAAGTISRHSTTLNRPRIDHPRLRVHRIRPDR